jgi:hypothetical protein
MQTKKCTKCGEEKDVSEFYKQKEGNAGIAIHYKRINFFRY